ncbi:hypothetical protein ACI2JA_03240 [Alkalihalobacillus sp. NPDC078783]
MEDWFLSLSIHIQTILIFYLLASAFLALIYPMAIDYSAMINKERIVVRRYHLLMFIPFPITGVLLMLTITLVLGSSMIVKGWGYFTHKFKEQFPRLIEYMRKPIYKKDK